jgi:hypothetical protein
MWQSYSIIFWLKKASINSKKEFLPDYNCMGNNVFLPYSKQKFPESLLISPELY